MSEAVDLNFGTPPANKPPIFSLPELSSSIDAAADGAGAAAMTVSEAACSAFCFRAASVAAISGLPAGFSLDITISLIKFFSCKSSKKRLRNG